eukprot:CAMPEP_0182496876 /NCGR_PEP_ID=MMETSP1321-20130603/5461_1 /TAXON_ID=91990 /ORGANISM="Bolidomonas sp., Strain RCC1657" /LENGTH=52 /DNA_ID=CAMNT_0024700605 /DNA_START=67 /DNA_END=222 /DNA_ORIENTATION=+
MQGQGGNADASDTEIRGLPKDQLAPEKDALIAKLKSDLEAALRREKAALKRE